MLQIIQDVQRPAIGVLGLLLAFVVALLSIKALKRPASEYLAASPVISLPRGEPVHEPTYITMPAAPVPVANIMRDRVSATVETQPDVAARLVRAWIKEG